MKQTSKPTTEDLVDALSDVERRIDEEDTALTITALPEEWRNDHREEKERLCSHRNDIEAMLGRDKED